MTPLPLEDDSQNLTPTNGDSEMTLANGVGESNASCARSPKRGRQNDGDSTQPINDRLSMLELELENLRLENNALRKNAEKVANQLVKNQDELYVNTGFLEQRQAQYNRELAQQQEIFSMKAAQLESEHEQKLRALAQQQEELRASTGFIAEKHRMETQGIALEVGKTSQNLRENLRSNTHLQRQDAIDIGRLEEKMKGFARLAETALKEATEAKRQLATERATMESADRINEQEKKTCPVWTSPGHPDMGHTE